ncbi:hypothetical protein ACQR3W_21965 [Rhodococcus ruber]|uniref:Uncharacterized protein n=1 Tax=Rhodococcus ruber TaxID=1830 RepID=A0A098BMT5_9NOCA|nr:hypothetical protein [Rhodococcus ruber]MCZ4505916.1 hypothetical protein [Rhodococcus ruber]MCZ4533458.1 hypothetical protein [Rhodococcus ruber]CDZ89031.1 hypothetical protein RHRU231_450198 [Rhodococcus ruber]
MCSAPSPIQRRIATRDGEDYITVEALDASNQDLSLVEAFGMLELARMHFTISALGFDYEDDEADE